MKENRGEGQRNRYKDEKRSKVTNAMLLSLMKEEGAISQGMWVASRSLEKTQNKFSPRVSRKECSSDSSPVIQPLDFRPVSTMLDF